MSYDPPPPDPRVRSRHGRLDMADELERWLQRVYRSDLIPKPWVARIADLRADPVSGALREEIRHAIRIVQESGSVER